MNDKPSTRIVSVDALRGLVMIIMALDHVRDFFHHDSMLFSPEDLSRTTAAIFFTRWITHFCAPVFMFTAGIGAWFWWQRRNFSRPALSRFLLTRGLWLILLELTVLRFAFFLGLFQGPVLLTVLWALGTSMVALSIAIWLPLPVLTILSLALVALHNLADGITANNPFWLLLHRQGIFRLGSAFVFVVYPIIPWIAVMALGFCFGAVMQRPPEVRRRIIIRLGLALTALFVLLRAINLYGDPFHWQPNHIVLGFLRATKYPPSLDYILMTLGPALLMLAYLDAHPPQSNRNPLLVFGRAPLFYFLGHFVLAHLLLFPYALLRYGQAGFLFNPLPSLGGPPNVYPADFGVSLGATYAVWLFVVVVMYPLCLWFTRLKQRRRDSWWASYV